MATVEYTETKASKKKVKSIAQAGITIKVGEWVENKQVRYISEAVTAQGALSDLQDISWKDFQQAETAYNNGKNNFTSY